MAKPLSNEQELYNKIKTEKITVPFLIWDLMYHYLGDDISAITQIVSASCRYNEPIPVDDTKRIQDHTTHINETVNKILHSEKIKAESEQLPELRHNHMKLHPVISELFFHYIGNDVHGINLIVGFYLDPADIQPIPIEDAKKILEKTSSMKQFMDTLREATHQEVTA